MAVLPGATASTSSELEIATGLLDIDATSRIDVTGRGYLGGRTAENAANEGRTLGNVAGSSERNGGSYGGLGAVGNSSGGMVSSVRRETGTAAV